MKGAKPLLLFLLLTAYRLQLTAAFSESGQIGVLVLAHGGSPGWNDQVTQAVEQAHLPYPYEIVFGMGMEPKEAAHLQRAVSALEARGIQEILAVPLLISSYSSVYRQYEYLLGLRKEGSWPEHPVEPVRLRCRIRVASALDDSPWVARILLERAMAMSANPAGEVVVLVAHGPEEESDNASWLEVMERLGATLRQEGGFVAVEALTLRDDAPEEVQRQAAQKLREKVASLSGSWQVLVVPLLISQGGIEEKIPQQLSGLSYRFLGEGLLPHPHVARWLKEAAEL